MKNKGMLASLLSVALLCPTAAGVADAPASQFGFKGWPYRQATNCGSVSDCSGTDCPVHGDSCVGDDYTSNLPQSTYTPVTTPALTPIPTVKPTIQPQPTKAPQATAKPQGGMEAYSPDERENQMFALVNSDRAANGLPALALDPQLCYLARLKSEDMRNNNYFAHQSPTYGNAAEMLTAFGYRFNGVGENIAHHATVEKAQAAFLSSEGHRRNIMGSQWTKVGIGVCFDDNGFVYVTQMFAR